MRFLGKLRHLEAVISQETGKGSSQKILSLCSSDCRGYFPEQMQSTTPKRTAISQQDVQVFEYVS